MSIHNVAKTGSALTTRWRRPGIRRDLLTLGLFCYLGKQEEEKTQAPQLEAVSWQLLLELVLRY